MKQHDDESAIDYLRRVVHNLDYEDEAILQSLPTVGAIMEYCDLLELYDAEFYSGMVDAIHEGSLPVRFRNFARKWNLEWEV